MLEVDETAAQVGPELFQFVGEDIHQNLCFHHVGGADDGVRAGMVGVGEAGSDAIADKFRVVELRFSPIVRARNDDPHGGVKHAVKGVSGSHLVVARILVEQRRPNGARIEAGDDGVGIGSTVSFGIADKPLAISRIIVVGLSNAGLDADEDDFNRVEGL